MSSASRTGSAHHTPTRGVRRETTLEKLRTPLAVRIATAKAQERAAAKQAPTASRSARPAWNDYLTDEKQYKLSNDRRLLKHMQQLSAAHFHTRSSPHRFIRRSPSESAASDEYDERQADQMRGEIRRLERMLSQLEVESTTGIGYAASQQPNDQEEERSSGNEDEFEGEDATHSDSYEFESVDQYLVQVCQKSIGVGLQLSRRVNGLQVELEQALADRQSHEDQINRLQMEQVATNRQLTSLTVRYQDMTGQVDAMRDALIATEEALHRLTVELTESRTRGSRAQYSPAPKSYSDVSPRSIASSHDGNGPDPVTFHIDFDNYP